jgi:hypothetical protein
MICSVALFVVALATGDVRAVEQEPTAVHAAPSAPR